MKCLYCEYESGFNNAEMDIVEGREGPFYKLPIDLERQRKWESYKDRVNLFGCPQYKKTFIQDE